MHYVVKKLTGFPVTVSNRLFDFVSNVAWALAFFPFVVLRLRRQGFRNIEVFKPLSWHYTSRYLTCEKGDRMLFVKTGKRFLVSNEIKANQMLAEANPTLVPKLVDQHLCRFWPLNYVVFEFLEGHKPLSSVGTITITELSEFRHALETIVETLSALGITHRDLTPDNIFVPASDFGAPKVIDFSMAEGPALQALDFNFRNAIVLRGLGYKYRPAPGVWDDRFSAQLIIKELRERVVDR